MIETLMQIKEAEKEVTMQREKADEELQQLRERLNTELVAKQKADELAVADYREKEVTKAEQQLLASKQNNQQRAAETAKQLAERFEQRHEQVVEIILKEVEELYGHF